MVELGAGQAKILGIQVGSAAPIEPIPLPPADTQLHPLLPHQGGVMPVPMARGIRACLGFFPFNTKTGF